MFNITTDSRKRRLHWQRILFAVFSSAILFFPASSFCQEQAVKLFEQYCFECHDADTREGNLDLKSLFANHSIDKTRVFENLITGRMPPSSADMPPANEKRVMLEWLAKTQDTKPVKPFRRINRFEFEYSLNDLIGTNYSLADNITEDRGTLSYDTDRRIPLTRQMLATYFDSTDQLLDHAFPANGFLPEMTWTCNRIKESHETYRIYYRPYKAGHLFSWTRANNGNSYSFFYDDFEPPQSGWYELTFEAAKVGDFPEDVTVQVYAGKHYIADDRPQPQRLVDVISLGNKDLKTYTIKGFLDPGESVSVHCFSKHTWRQINSDQGAYIKKLVARGPLTDGWPPKPYKQVFLDRHVDASPRPKISFENPEQSSLKVIGGSLSVSSFQPGMEKERMLDGVEGTFWHTRFSPSLAPSPHFVVINNPESATIKGLKYSTWTGGNGNGQIKAYTIFVSDDGRTWGKPIARGNLQIKNPKDQLIIFNEPTNRKHVKFHIDDAYSIDGRSLASIGKLDVILTGNDTENTGTRNLTPQHQKVTVRIESLSDLKQTVTRIAKKAYSSELTEKELEPYVDIATAELKKNQDFVAATKLGIKSVVCSHRFLYSPGTHSNTSFRKAAQLARTIWLSVPDERLLLLAKQDALHDKILRTELDRMLLDPRSKRMTRSLCGQWLNLRTFKKVSPSLKLYPLYDDLLDHFLPLETEAYLNDMIANNLPIEHIIDSQHAFLNQRLAQHYGIENVYGQTLRKLPLPKDSPRGGLLTMGSILKVTSDGFQTSPILRGAWISKRIAGNHLSPPPESVKAIDSHTASATTIRERIELHKTNPNCAACHRQIDPYGFALENFDATGRWRTNYSILVPHQGTFQYRREGYWKEGKTVDASGIIDDIRFADVFGLKKQLLTDHKKVAYNFMKQYFEYANGYSPNLKQRLKLHSSIPGTSKDCRTKDLLIEVLLLSLSEDAL